MVDGVEVEAEAELHERSNNTPASSRMCTFLPVLPYMMPHHLLQLRDNIRTSDVEEQFHVRYR
jgi:hypothetical protein